MLLRQGLSHHIPLLLQLLGLLSVSGKRQPGERWMENAAQLPGQESSPAVREEEFGGVAPHSGVCLRSSPFLCSAVQELQLPLPAQLLRRGAALLYKRFSLPLVLEI